MPTRTRTAWKLRSDGQYDCRVGWKINANGKREQHRFRLGNELREAKRRDSLLRQIWERIESSVSIDPIWTAETLELAKVVAGGESQWLVPKQHDEPEVPYAQRVQQLRRTFPMFLILPQLEYGAVFGVALLESLDRASAEAEAQLDVELAQDSQNLFRRMKTAFVQDVPQESGPYLHDAFKAYTEWLKSEYSHPETTVTAWGRTQINQVESLIAHHADRSLKQIGRVEVEEMFRYWRQRPMGRGKSKKRISKKSATHYISALKSFFKWLHVQPSFRWRKPEDFADLKTRVISLPTEPRRQVSEDHLFTLEELKLLYRFATPLDRLLILLGLNCGFGAAESASLLIGEVSLRVLPPPRQLEMLGFAATPSDSFIRRERRKTGVYGEHLLFPATVAGIQWAIAERRRQGFANATDRVLLNGAGEPFDKPTRSGNGNRQIPNSFKRLLDRIKDDKNQISQLPFKMLRKTGGDLIKRFSDGEVAGVFLCHGKPVDSDELSDAYTQRCFGKVFRAIQEVEQYLSPMFAECSAAFRT